MCIVAFLITVITDDLVEVRPLSAVTLAILLFCWGCIRPRGRSVAFSLLSPYSPVLLFFFSSLLRLLGLFVPLRLLSSFFCLRAGLFLGLLGLLVSLIIPRIETHLQGLFPFGTPLMKVGTPLNLGPGLSLIGCPH